MHSFNSKSPLCPLRYLFPQKSQVMPSFLVRATDRTDFGTSNFIRLCLHLSHLENSFIKIFAESCSSLLSVVATSFSMSKEPGGETSKLVFRELKKFESSLKLYNTDYFLGGGGAGGRETGMQQSGIAKHSKHAHT